VVEARLSFGLGTILGLDVPVLYGARNKQGRRLCDVRWRGVGGANAACVGFGLMLSCRSFLGQIGARLGLGRARRC
jgi:hypothetical protein